MERVEKRAELSDIHLLSRSFAKYHILKCVLWQGGCWMAKESSEHFETKGKYRKEFAVKCVAKDHTKNTSISLLNLVFPFSNFTDPLKAICQNKCSEFNIFS